MATLEPIEISVVVPVYNCKDCLAELHTRLVAALRSLCSSYEIIFINDSSPDNCWSFIKSLAETDSNVKAINFSRNYGQHHALTAGFDVAKGNWVVAMDCDLQDPPEEISKLYRKALEGHDIVYGVSDFRGKPGLVSQLIRKTYFWMLDRFSGNKYKTTNMSFYIASRQVVLNLRKFREKSRHISSLIRELGFNITGVQVEHHQRKHGESSYTLSKKLALGVQGLIGYSSMLLKLSLFLGFTFSCIAFLSGSYIFFQAFTIENYALAGWASPVTIILFLAGVILVSLGVLGLYIEQIFLEVKDRPLYVVREKINLDQNEA